MNLVESIEGESCTVLIYHADCEIDPKDKDKIIIKIIKITGYESVAIDLTFDDVIEFNTILNPWFRQGLKITNKIIAYFKFKYVECVIREKSYLNGGSQLSLTIDILNNDKNSSILLKDIEECAKFINAIELGVTIGDPNND